MPSISDIDKSLAHITATTSTFICVALVTVAVGPNIGMCDGQTEVQMAED